MAKSQKKNAFFSFRSEFAKKHPELKHDPIKLSKMAGQAYRKSKGQHGGCEEGDTNCSNKDSFTLLKGGRRRRSRKHRKAGMRGGADDNDAEGDGSGPTDIPEGIPEPPAEAQAAEGDKPPEVEMDKPAEGSDMAGNSDDATMDDTAAGEDDPGAEDMDNMMGGRRRSRKHRKHAKKSGKKSMKKSHKKSKKHHKKSKKHHKKSKKHHK